MPEGRIKKTDPDKKYRSVMSASSLAGDTVRNPAGDDLGKIKDIMIDINRGQIAYAVLSFGGVLGMGDKLFAIPWNALELDEDEKCFIMDADKETLESAPGFDKDNWPDMADQAWGSRIHEHYGTEPYWNDRDIVSEDEDRTQNRTLRGGGSY